MLLSYYKANLWPPAASIAAALRLMLATAALAVLTGCVALPNPLKPFGLSAAPPATAEERARLVTAINCDQHRNAAHAGQTIAERRHAIDREVIAYQTVVERALATRAQAIRVLDQVRAKAADQQPLSGMDLQNLNQSAGQMLDLRAELFAVSLTHECWLDEPVPALRQEAEIQAIGIAMGLSAALVLYDNYLSSIALYRSDPLLRQHFNRGDSGFAIREGELNRIATSFGSPDNRARVRRGLIWFEQHGQPDLAQQDEAYRYLVQLIEQSPSRQMVRRIHPVIGLTSTVGFLSTFSFDSMLGLKNEGFNVTSMLFGNTVGLVELRRGKLYGRPEVLSRMSETARAGDILLEKTPFRLTDAFIPGHWGHAAIWVGTETELRALGIWDHAAVHAHQEAIRNGRGVVEALRSGVEMNTLAQFLNVDDLALLRQENLSDAERAAVILQALRQVGKSYDFNFDVETTDRIVCSELVYHAYGHLEWPTKRVLGRVTISPDNIAVRATGRGLLTIAALYHDGEQVASAGPESMEKLVQRSVVQLARR
ncbi:MAG: Poxvirus G6 [Sterolibacteriaceae bacterium]|nr:Poxvirus G6 [Candidatus Methylophosphatis haderslevensis]